MFDPKKMVNEENPEEEKKTNKRFSTPNRRDFLKGMAIGAGAVALSPIMTKKADAIDIDVFAFDIL